MMMRPLLLRIGFVLGTIPTARGYRSAPRAGSVGMSLFFFFFLEY